MVWKDSYRLGIDIIDKEHRKLFNMVEETANIVKESKYDVIRAVKCREAMVFLQAYVILHFSHEEEYMEQIAYPHLAEHRALHEEFKSRVAEQEEKLEKANYADEVVLESVHMLEMWLIHHVLSEDQKIAGNSSYY